MRRLSDVVDLAHPTMIIVIGAIVARPDTIDEVLEHSLAHVQRSRTEPGCLLHSVHRDVENEHRVVFVEQWADRAALDEHFAVPASNDFVRTVAALADGAPTIEIHEVVDR